MTLIEWIAAILAIWVFVKFVLLSVKPREFINWSENLIKPNKMKVFGYVELILFFLLAYLLLQEISVVQLFIAMLAGMMLISHTMMHYPKVMGLLILQLFCSVLMRLFGLATM